MKLISKAALLILLLAILSLLITGNLISRSPLVAVGQVLAIALAIWSRRSFGATPFSIHAEPIESSLLAAGPYRFIRHPMYAAALLFLWVSILGHLVSGTVLIGLVVTAVIAVRIVTEEALLETSYPDYGTYAGKTKRLIPYVY
jgi:protein-S-isoprenylcysteine O-methyltransferase Ste14